MREKQIENFRKAHKDGKISVECSMENGVAFVDVRAYANNTMNTDEYLAKYKAMCFEPDNDKLNDAIEKAVDRCMAFIGVCSGSNMEEPDKEAFVVKTRKPRKTKEEKSREEVNNKPDEDTTILDENQLSIADTVPEAVPDTAHELESNIENTQEIPVENCAEESLPVSTNEVVADATEDTAVAVNAANDTNAVIIMDVKTAKQYQIPCGMHKGKYIGELLATNRSAVEYFAKDYKGTDNNLRKAARIALGLEEPADF